MNAIVESPLMSGEQRIVFADILSQAITGELTGMANYAAMVQLHPDVEGQKRALGSAATELAHSERFDRAALELGVVPIVNPGAPYWHRIRLAFLRHVKAEDFIGCVMIQEVMLEALAISMYRAVSEIAPEPLAAVFRAVGEEEAQHADHALALLQAAFAADRDGFESKAEALHDEVMTTLAEMLGAKDTVGHCGLCHDECIKGSLHLIGLDRARLRGLALNQYLRTLDRIGIRGERSLAWVARLPL